MSVTIYHNPRCSKSRQTLALLEERGAAPRIIEYLKTPPDEKTLAGLLKKLGMKPQQLIRKKEYRALGLPESCGALSPNLTATGLAGSCAPDWGRACSVWPDYLCQISFGRRHWQPIDFRGHYDGVADD